MNKISFCYIIDNSPKFKDLLIRSLYSLVKYYNDNIEDIYILASYQLSKEYELILKNIYNNIKIINVDLSIVDCIDYPYEAVSAKRVSKTALIKFFIHTLLNIDKLFYVDCDIVFYNNMYNILIENIDENIIFKGYSNRHMLNSGLLYINCKKLREEKNLLNDIIEFYKKPSLNVFVDQHCFMYLTYGQYRSQSIIDENDNIHVDIGGPNMISLIKSDILIENHNYFIYHALGEYKRFMLEVFDEFVRDDNFDKLCYNDIYFNNEDNI